ncbi:MAG: ATP-binding protein, partial [Nitrososphaerota archaeon]|nr:ATP-binding protein [Nitrososphaerota archaeon]
MGWKLTAFVFLFAVWALNVGALVVGVPILVFVLYRYWSDRQAKPRAGRSHWMIYLGAFLIFLSIVAVAEQGTYSPIVFGAAGVSLLVLGLFPGLTQGFVDTVSGPASELFGGASRKKDGLESARCVELTTVPLGYLDPKKAEPKEVLPKFQRLSQTFAELGHPVEMRLEFAEGQGRILFSCPDGEAERVDGLLHVVKSQLSEFRAEVVEAKAEPHRFSSLVEGAPEPSPDPVTPLAKYFVENRLAGSYCVRISPGWVNPVSRWAAGWKQRRAAEGSGYQRVDYERTTTVVNHPRQVELEDSVKALDRLLAKRPVRVSVMVSADDEEAASHAAYVLAGALSSQRKIDGLKVRKPRAPPRSGWRRSTLMLPSEAAPFLWLPQAALGTKVAPSAEFHAPPMTEGDILLGEAVSLSGTEGQDVRVPRDQLAKHVFVTGMTGSGKTTTCFVILRQLAKLGIPFLVVEPVKAEYRRLLMAVRDLQVFTLGEKTAPFGLNIFEPPEGVKVQAHLEGLVSVWNSSFVSYAPVPYVVEQVFAETYRACGWDLEEDTHGRPVTFDDVAEQVRRVVRGLGYEPRVTMDVEAAINVRLGSLVLGGKRRLFGARASTPMQEIMSKPTILELKGIQRDEEKAFVASLLMMNVAGYMQAKGASRRLRHFTLIEEAHRLLPKVSTEKGDPEAADARRAMVESFGNMLAELRAYGEGLAVVEQIPTKILPDAIKNTATKLVHRLPDLPDREAMAGAMNATEEQ